MNVSPEDASRNGGYSLRQLGRVFWPYFKPFRRQIAGAVLALMLVAGALLVMGVNTALVMYSFHSRQLGAREDLVLLHTGLLALTVGGCGSLWGAAADRWGQRRKMMLAALGGAALLAFEEASA